MATGKKDRQWDGRSRPSDDKYRKEFDRIFKPKTLHEELIEGFEKEKQEHIVCISKRTTPSQLF